MTLHELRKIPHLSASSLGTYVECSLQYKFSRIDGIPAEFIADSLVFGNGIHYTLADYYQALMEGEILSGEVLQERFTYHWEQLAKDKYQIRYFKGNSYHAILTQGQKLMETFAEQVPEETSRILGVEQTFSFSVPGLPLPIIGAMDLLLEDPDGTLTIVDHKTTSKALGSKDIDMSDQLTIYQKALKSMGYIDRQIILRLDCLVKTKTPRFEQVYTSRSECDEQRMIRKFQAAWDAIYKEVWVPNTASWKCGTCAYKGACDDWFQQKAA